MKVHAKTWCCVDQGHAYIKTFFEKSHYLPGEEARLAIEIDNS